MTQTRRLFVNVMASHGRAMFVMVCGLLTGRWALMALGPVDYGLLGLIGGLMVFITLINSVLAGAISRFFAVSIGEAKTDAENGLEICRRWFNVALLIHTVVPLMLVAIGYPVGLYFIEHVLNIPPDRMTASIWVFRWTCLSAFVGMVTVPCRAMYTAKQYIAELTVYSVFQTTVYTIVLYYMVSHPGDWLAWTALWMALQASSVNFILAIRSFCVFPECIIKFDYMCDWARIKKIAAYSCWQFISTLGITFRTQGIAVLVNKYFSPVMNASYTVAGTVSGHSQTFAREVDLAFAPAIFTAYGEKDRALCLALVYRCSKFASWLVAVFVVPLMLEMNEVLTLWLKNPPPYSSGICVFLCLMLLTEKLSSGQYSVVNATGSIRVMQLVSSAAFFGTVVIVWIGFAYDCGMYTVGLAMWIMSIVDSVGHVLIARRVAFVPLSPWINMVVLPLVIVMLLSVPLACIPSMFFEPTFFRVVITSCCFLGVFIPLSWKIFLAEEEKKFIARKIYTIFKQG